MKKIYIIMILLTGINISVYADDGCYKLVSYVGKSNNNKPVNLETFSSYQDCIDAKSKKEQEQKKWGNGLNFDSYDCVSCNTENRKTPQKSFTPIFDASINNAKHIDEVNSLSQYINKGEVTVTGANQTSTSQPVNKATTNKPIDRKQQHTDTQKKEVNYTLKDGYQLMQELGKKNGLNFSNYISKEQYNKDLRKMSYEEISKWNADYNRFLKDLYGDDFKNFQKELKTELIDMGIDFAEFYVGNSAALAASILGTPVMGAVVQGLVGAGAELAHAYNNNKPLTDEKVLLDALLSGISGVITVTSTNTFIVDRLKNTATTKIQTILQGKTNREGNIETMQLGINDVIMEFIEGVYNSGK